MSKTNWQKKHELELRKAFRKAAKHFDDFSRSAKPIGMGCFGLTLTEDEDGTITKILYRPDPKWTAYAQDSFQNEVNVLRILADNPLDGVQTPALIGEPEETPDNKKFIGRFHMTRIQGRTSSFYYPEDFVPADVTKKIHESAGRALAIFHKEAAKTPLAHYERPEGVKSTAHTVVTQIPDLSETINQALANANTYLQENLKSGIIHGDYHAGNILFDDDHNAVGIIDLAYTGKAPNIYIDFATSNEEYRDDFIRGYEDASGTKIDKDMIAVTRLATSANYMYHLTQFEEETDKNDPRHEKRKERNAQQRINVQAEIEDGLKKLSHITGYQP
ncbi:MAG: aminoglycoside phosphotransferase family protein [Rhodospirillales bacterium]|nr:aminoglycoside phosphotransferase family protein [Rhodospirillales bacterium]MCB9995354.1 aminoglycoside phosphotransferase family protein [Rhodospirillales bacterium]